MTVIDSDAMRFWDGAAWVELAVGPKGFTGAPGPAGTAVEPVKSLGSRNLVIPGSPNNTPTNDYFVLGNLSTRTDEINSPIAAMGTDAFEFVSPEPTAYMVSVAFRLGSGVSTARLLVMIVRRLADGSTEELARRTLGVSETGLTVNAVFLHNDPTDELGIMGWSQSDTGAYTARLSVAPVGPLVPFNALTWDELVGTWDDQVGTWTDL